MNVDRGATRWRALEEPCLNCGDTTSGKFCPTCGQRKTEVLVSLRTMLADVLEDQLVLNRTLPRTIGALLFKPGLLTAEYVRGRIVRYTAPFRLYLMSSVVFFLILSFVGLNALTVNIDTDGDAVPADSAGATVADSAESAPADTPRVDSAAVPVQVDSAATPVDTLAAAADNAVADSASAASAAEDSLPDTGAPLPVGTMQRWARNIRYDSSSPVFERAIGRKIAQVGHLPLRDAMRELLRDLLEYAPHMVFIMLPFYAFLLKLLYIRRSRYYAEHFVFALHVHAFFFVLFTLMFLLPDWLDIVLWLWLVAYVWIALKRVYGQGWLRTTLKWWTLGWTYSFFVTAGVVGLAIATLLLT